MNTSLTPAIVLRPMITLLLLLSLSFSSTGNAAYRQIEVTGTINPGSADFILDSLQKAQEETALLIKLNTPGGLLSSTRDIIQGFSQSNVPVIVFVTPGGASATSAGALITMASHIAVMSPGTNIGAAHPVATGGQEVKGPMGDKVTNDTAALARSQATLRGRNAALAEAIVTQSKSFTAEEALKNKLINYIAKDTADLLSQLEGEKILVNDTPLSLTSKEEIIHGEMNLKQKFLHIISDPNISTMLLALGGLAIYVEVSSGFATIFPGTFGLFCLLLGFISLQTLPVNVGGALLFILGFALLIAEAFITSYGLLTVASLISLFLGGLFLIDPATGGNIRVSYSILIPLIAGIGFVALFIAFQFIRDRLANKSTIAIGDSMVGAKAIVDTVEDTNKVGTAYINGELWTFFSDEPLEKGQEAIVESLQGMKVKLRRKP